MRVVHHSPRQRQSDVARDMCAAASDPKPGPDPDPDPDPNPHPNPNPNPNPNQVIRLLRHFSQQHEAGICRVRSIKQLLN